MGAFSLLEFPFESTVDATVETTVDSTINTTVERAIEPAVESTVESTVEPALESIMEPTTLHSSPKAHSLHCGALRHWARHWGIAQWHTGAHIEGSLH